MKLLDCCLISDGSGALIITTEERAWDLRKPPVYLLGFGEGHTQEHLVAFEDLTLTACKRSGARALQMAGIRLEEIDVAELYDCFTITVLLELEDLGFCAKGEAGAFVEDGRIELGGQLPVNTHGGLLSQGQPGGFAGLFHVIEAVRQLRGEAAEAQVEGAKLALVHGNGGVMSAQCTLILGV